MVFRLALRSLRILPIGRIGSASNTLPLWTVAVWSMLQSSEPQSDQTQERFLSSGNPSYEQLTITVEHTTLFIYTLIYLTHILNSLHLESAHNIPVHTKLSIELSCWDPPTNFFYEFYIFHVITLFRVDHKKKRKITFLKHYILFYVLCRGYWDMNRHQIGQINGIYKKSPINF